LDLIYFRPLDLVHEKVAYNKKTKSKNNLYWFRKLSGFVEEYLNTKMD
jgi:hypothetical protein